MYTHLTTYDANRHLASLARRGAFDRPAASEDLRPIRRTLRSRIDWNFAHLLRHRAHTSVVTHAAATAA